MLTVSLETDIDDFAKGLEAVFHGKATLLNRMRLSCTFYDKDEKKMDNDGACHECLFASNEPSSHPSFRMAGHERDRTAPRVQPPPEHNRYLC